VPKKHSRASVSNGVLEEFEDAPTVEDTIGPCRYCDLELPHRGRQAIPHAAPLCRLPCLGGGVSVGIEFHSDRCPSPLCRRARIARALSDP
jgi:hypothetical protein